MVWGVRPSPLPLYRQKRGTLLGFPRATRPACLPRVSCSTLGVFCETGHILSCDGGALVLCSHAGSRFELCISSHAMGDAGSCVSLATLIRVMFLHLTLHAAIFVGVSTAGACSSSCHQRTASQRGSSSSVLGCCNPRLR